MLTKILKTLLMAYNLIMLMVFPIALSIVVPHFAPKTEDVVLNVAQGVVLVGITVAVYQSNSAELRRLRK